MMSQGWSHVEFDESRTGSRLSKMTQGLGARLSRRSQVEWDESRTAPG